MDDSLKWLPEAVGTPWEPLGMAMRAGLPVPNGFVVQRQVSEHDIRAAYEEIKIRERTHFVAVRGDGHTDLNVIGPDALVHRLRRIWLQAPEAHSLIQRMVPAVWCGKAHWHRKNLRIRANEGMMILDPDTYLVDTDTLQCIQSTLEPKQRRMIRHVDGSTKVVHRDGERTPMSNENLAKVAGLAVLAAADIGWAIDDLEKVWLISAG